MFDKIFPKEVDFFDLFDKVAVNVARAAVGIVELLEKFDNLEERVKQIHEIEQEGDMLTHDIIKKLNKTFLTPIDREDLHALASRLDDILDLIWGAVDRISVFRIKESTPEVVEMAKHLFMTVEVIQKAMRKLKEKNYSHMQEYCIEINRLENRVDRDFRDALGKLFDNFSNDPVLIIKWKEIYEHLENASDKCEDVANILESIVLKHA